jgi:type II secretory pathway pseudopilin PulG
MNHRNLPGTGDKRSRGFSTLEVLLVMVVSLIIAAFAIPGFNQVQRTLRISGDARNLNGAINQAKMEAAADFTETRVYIDLGANRINTFHVDVWNKAGNGGLGCWQVVGELVRGGVLNPCFLAGASPVQSLSPGVAFGFNGVGAPPPNTQANGIGQGQLRCTPVNGKRVGQVATTACIQFNSRGIPVDLATGAPTGNDAVYITDNTQVYGVTVSATGLSQVWANNVKGNANWYHK